jgi:ribosome-associated protein
MQEDEMITPVSKTRRKKEMHDLQALGERLTELNRTQLESLSLPESLRDAVLDAHAITRHEARRRHMQFIGKLMRNIDPEPIRERIAEWDGQSSSATAEQHRLERWRERLIEEEGALAEYIEYCRSQGAARESIDIQHLRSLIRHVREDRERGKPVRHYRELFRELKRISEGTPRGAATPANEADEGGDEPSDEESKP